MNFETCITELFGLYTSFYYTFNNYPLVYHHLFYLLKFSSALEKKPAQEAILLFTKKTSNMRKTFFIWLFIVAAFCASGQGKTLYTVNFVKPKPGMKSTFETNWKLHLAKFHKTS